MEIFGIFFILLAVASVGLFVWALVDVLGTQFSNQNTKLLWVLVVLLATFVGPLLWLVWGRNNAS